ncbi:hypothetical protein MLD38_038649 [Melastoma candidum]|uniref:Uncharacterized protein n=1 Tax=Melastoma candidum TaxID=119954 RepID=A0ACB9L0S0_9MYRT|nr:hypothetical protein MLD38_038649 [Melastoma candidum]
MYFHHHKETIGLGAIIADEMVLLETHVGCYMESRQFGSLKSRNATATVGFKLQLKAAQLNNSLQATHWVQSHPDASNCKLGYQFVAANTSLAFYMLYKLHRTNMSGKR